MIKVINHVKLDDKDQLDIEFWLKKTPADRLAEVANLRRNYFIWLNGSFPVSIEKVILIREL